MCVYALCCGGENQQIIPLKLALQDCGARSVMVTTDTVGSVAAALRNFCVVSDDILDADEADKSEQRGRVETLLAEFSKRTGIV